MFKFRLALEDGTPAGTFTTAAPNWKPGDTVMVTPNEQYRVVELRVEPDEERVLVVAPLLRALGIESPREHPLRDEGEDGGPPGLGWGLK